MRVNLSADSYLPEVRLFDSDKKALKFLKKRIGHDASIDDKADGQTWFLEGPHTMTVILIRRDRMSGFDDNTVKSLIAHEATHAVFDYLSYMGEDEQAHEEMAYMVQMFCDALFRAYDEMDNKADHLTVDGEPTPEIKAAG